MLKPPLYFGCARNLWSPRFRGLFQLEITRENSDDLSRRAIQDYAPPHSAAVAREPALPKSFANQDHGVMAWLPFLFRKQAAGDRLDA
jgi:hypothetical protein